MNEYDSDKPEAVIPPEKVVDDPKKPFKAYVPTVLSAAAMFGTMWVADEDPFTAKEAVQAGIQSLIASGLIGAATFFTPNPKKVVSGPPPAGPPNTARGGY